MFEIMSIGGSPRCFCIASRRAFSSDASVDLGAIFDVRFPIRQYEWVYEYPPQLQNLFVTATLFFMSKVAATVAQETDEELALASIRRAGATELELAKRAFSSIYARHSRLLRAFLSSRVPRGDLDDIEQAIWEKVWLKLPEQFQGGNFRAWLHQIARNYIVDFFRRSRTEELPEAFDARDHKVATPDAILMNREQLESLEACLKKLNAQNPHMATLVRGRLSGDSYESLCESLNVDNAKAQKLLFTAKRLLQTCVEGGGQ